MQKKIKDAIYEKYIVPTTQERPEYIGVEIELPVVNLSGAPAEEEISIKTASGFSEKFGFIPESHDSDGNVNSFADKETGDLLSFDCSYSNLELSFGRADNLFEIKERFEKYYRFLKSEFSVCNYTLTGMGVNPNADINHNKPIPNERYRMLYHYLHSYRKHINEVSMTFHDRPDFGTFTSASQVQIDVRYDELIDVINTLGMVEPYKSLLFANSYLPQYPELLCSRNMLWERSMQGYNPHNIGMFEENLSDVEELIEYIGTQSIYCAIRNGKYLDFTPVPVSEYFERDKITGEYFDDGVYKTLEFSPLESDIEYLRTFKFIDLTFRGTIEYRSSCTQPVSEALTVAAFHVGLADRINELNELLEKDDVIYRHGFNAAELQKMLSRRDLPDFISREKLSRQLLNILDIASDGLKKRGIGEEILLEPLYERAEKLTNPAKEMITGIENGADMRYYIDRYAEL